MSEPNDFEVDEPKGTAPTGGDPNADDASLLTMPEKDAVARLVRDWEDSWKDKAPLLAQWQVNQWRQDGYTGVYVTKKQNESMAYLPLGAVPNIAGANKARRLCRRLASTQFTDPPVAEATPATDEDQDRDNAETATRVLQDLSSEGNLNYAGTAAEAFSVGDVTGSGFIRFWTDAYGNGWRPETIMARPEATTADDPLPTVGEPGPDGVPVVYTSAPVTRYVLEDGTLSDNPADPKVKKQWLPKIRRAIYNAKHIALYPGTANDVWEAEALQIGEPVQLGVLRNQFPDAFKRLTEDQIRAMVAYRPKGFKDLLPPGKKDKTDHTRPDAWVFVSTRWHVQCPDYDMGAYLIAAGDTTLLHRGTWYDDEHAQPMDIPVTQFKQYLQPGHPYGMGGYELFGPGNEVVASMTGSMLDYIDVFGNLPWVIPATGTMRQEQLQAGRRALISIMPNTEPKQLQIQDFPPILEKMFALQTRDMDDESGLGQTAQGLEGKDVNSGLHAQTIIEQVNVNLSDLKRHISQGLTRGWRIILQLVRRDYTIPQKVRFQGDDKRYKVKEFTGADLGNTVDVRIQPGSFTQLAPSSKAALAGNYAQMGVIPPEELRHILMGNVGGLIGLQDNPHVIRVRRQIEDWMAGPPEGTAEPVAPTDPMTGQPMMDMMTGQPMPAPTPEALTAIFAPLPVDEEQAVATVRAYELGRSMAGTRYGRWPAWWQAGYNQEYQRMRYFAGIQTVQEQAQAAQAQAAQQQDAERAESDQEARGAEQAGAQKAEVERIRQEGRIGAAAAKQRAGPEGGSPSPYSLAGA